MVIDIRNYIWTRNLKDHMRKHAHNINTGNDALQQWEMQSYIRCVNERSLLIAKAN